MMMQIIRFNCDKIFDNFAYSCKKTKELGLAKFPYRRDLLYS